MSTVTNARPPHTAYCVDWNPAGCVKFKFHRNTGGVRVTALCGGAVTELYVFGVVMLNICEAVTCFIHVMHLHGENCAMQVLGYTFLANVALFTWQHLYN